MAFGGGKGLAASLRALRTLDAEVTAVVTVADDGGSSGRLRATRPLVPPGDLRKALIALSDGDRELRAVFGHRFAGEDEIAGHAVGNLMLVALMERFADPVAALDAAAAMLGAHGRVLPMATEPLDIEADVELGGETVVVRGQHHVAVSTGTVRHVRLAPAEPRACAEAVEAVSRADWLVFGPGSWYTSVIPHLLVPELRRAIEASPARRIVVLNLSKENETAGLSLAGHLGALAEYAPGLTIDVVLADTQATGEPDPVLRAAQSLGARLLLAGVAEPDLPDRHDPAALAAALTTVIEQDEVG
ncbi:putative cofD-like protein [Stackebrandtia albiflava]|uniref:Putative gluconeogenesis factor n=1 Tax=Stackebrandtia albiflava TaxID=406432 RepID=A0A562VD25_9ACTN|nr:putative cofD-like protein [Stackebrandtia albiflava]